MKNVNLQLYNSVTETFQTITQELSKPQEDVVTISVCGSTKYAIENVLKLYLESIGADTTGSSSINDLADICIRHNEKFQRFDFSSLICRCDPSTRNSRNYCLREESINSCYELLAELKDFIFDELKISRKD